MVIIFHNSSSFKYKSSLITNRNGVKITVLLKYLSNFWRSLEMWLINCKIELSLSLDPNCVLSNLVQASIFTITDAKLYVPIVLRDKAFKIASDPKYDGYQRGLASMVYNFLIKSLVEKIISFQMNFISRLLKSLTEENFIHYLETIYGC